MQRVLTATLLAVFLDSAASAWPGQETPRPEVPMEDCFWSSVSSDPAWNYVYPDQNSVYQCTSFSVPEGAELVIHGEYPRARSLSWTGYGTSGAHQLVDTEIRPDAGSSNPFLPSSDRHAAERSYTLRGVAVAAPAVAKREPNLLYLGPEPGPGAKGIGRFGHVICARIYVPDRGTGPFGGTRLPQVSLSLPDGSTLEGEAMCLAVDALHRGFGVPPSSPGFDLRAYLARREAPGRPSTHPAQDPPLFRAFFNARHQGCVFFTPEADCGASVYNPAGVGLGNPSNRYIETWADQGFGRVLVLRGKLPTTPKTWHGPRVLSEGDTQLRYFSVCTQESLATWRVGDCVFDEEIPTDATGHYTIAVSRPSFRPANARSDCGVAWLEVPAAGDGAGDLWLYDIWVRHQLPSPSFAEAAQNVAEPGQEQAVMGAYYPRGQYLGVAEFEALGCPAAAP